MISKMELPSTQRLISTAASVAATTAFVHSFASDFIPHELRDYLFEKFRSFLATLSNETVLTIDEVDGLNKNGLFYAAELYLGTIGEPSARLFRALLSEKEKKIQVSIGGNEEVTDNFCGIRLKWRMVVNQKQSRYVPGHHDDFYPNKTDVRYMELIFHKKHKSKVLDEYLPYVVERSMAVKEGKKTLKLYTLKNDRFDERRISPWQSVNLDHPATFETLAMDDEMKEMVIDDLDRFVKRKDFYRKVGKVWKRGYLLYGPPGTGKSSLIGAIANYLNFDVYDLELTNLRCNSDLRKLLISTGNRSILVVEDIDASIDLSERKVAAQKPRFPPGYPYHDQGPKVTLSGLLNFVDGLWSSCGDERIIVFTTNHREKLDPALLRPGRMDVHIHMSYCTPCGFKMLLKNYIGIQDSPLVSKAEGMISSTKVTPAEVGEQLLKNDDPELALQGLIKFLEQKREENLKEREVVAMLEEDMEAIQDVYISNGLEGLQELIDMDDESSVESGPDGLQELIDIDNESPAEITNRVVKKGEAANALKILLRFLGISGRNSC